jgi:hypothetical protein
MLKLKENFWKLVDGKKVSFPNVITFIKHIQRENYLMLPLKLSNFQETLPDGTRNSVILKLN